MKLIRYLVYFTVSMLNWWSTSIITGRFLPSTFTFSLTVTVKSRPSTLFKMPLTAQLSAVFDPHTIGMVYLDSDFVIRADVQVYEEVFLVLKPLFY